MWVRDRLLTACCGTLVSSMPRALPPSDACVLLVQPTAQTPEQAHHPMPGPRPTPRSQYTTPSSPQPTPDTRSVPKQWLTGVHPDTPASRDRLEKKQASDVSSPTRPTVAAPSPLAAQNDPALGGPEKQDERRRSPTIRVTRQNRSILLPITGPDSDDDDEELAPHALTFSGDTRESHRTRRYLDEDDTGGFQLMRHIGACGEVLNTYLALRGKRFPLHATGTRTT